MRLTEKERAENREALAAMDLPQRLDHILEYYRFPLVLALIAVVALGSVLYYRLTRKETLLYAACANISVGETLEEALDGGFARAAGRDPRRCGVGLYTGLYLSRDASVANHEYAYASQLKTLAAIANRRLDVALMNREAYDILSAGGYLMPLETLLSADDALAGRLAGHLAENAVVLEDNDIEHLLDESVPYRAVTETVANGLRLTDFPRFAQAGFSGEVILGVIGNTSRGDAVRRYIDYLTAPSPEP